MLWVSKAAERVPILRARAKAERDIYEALADLDPRVTEAFVKAVNRIQDEYKVRAVTEALQRGDIEGALRQAYPVHSLTEALQGAGADVGDESFIDALTAGLQVGASGGRNQMPLEQARRVGSLTLGHPNAVRYLQSTLPTKIQEIDEDTRRAIRDILIEGMRMGRPGPKMARDIRPLIGLRPDQAQAVQNLRIQLETGVIGKTTPPWGRRLSAVDRLKSKAVIEAGGEVSARVERIIADYSASLLNRRAMDIARTETHQAYGEGQAAIWDQAVDRGLLDPMRTRRFWIDTKDTRERAQHRVMPGLNRAGVGLHENFEAPPPVYRVSRPGASGIASFDVNCRCTVGLSFSD